MAKHSPNTTGREIRNGAEVPATQEVLDAVSKSGIHELMQRPDVQRLANVSGSVRQRIFVSGLVGDAAQLTVLHTDDAGKAIPGLPSKAFTFTHDALIRAMAA